MDDRGPKDDGRIVPIILAGGTGSRLWPVSSESHPKQFQPLIGPLSTYQQALQRAANTTIFDDPIVVTAERFRAIAREQAEAVGARPMLLLEPAQRDSAAAIAAAAAFVERRRPGALLMALAADHLILDAEFFQEAVKLGSGVADSGKIVAFGLVPSEPKTSYGYIRPGAPLSAHADVFAVEAFVEKPDLATAIAYLSSGYLWNSGNLLFRADIMIRELEIYAPEIMRAASAAVEHSSAGEGFFRLDEATFSAAPKISIDYALLEKTSEIAVVKGRFRWSDIGSWDSVWEASVKDRDGNALQGDGLVVASHRCLVRSDGPLIAVAGVEDLVVVASQGAVLVTSRKDAQRVKLLVDRLKDRTGPVEPETG